MKYTVEEIEGIQNKLHFGCPFKVGTVGEKDAEAFEETAEEAATIIRDLLAENESLKIGKECYQQETRQWLNEMAAKLQAAESRIKELAELLVDAELITRSRCKELTGMSHHEIAMLLADSPICREVRRETAEVCHQIAQSSQHGYQAAQRIRARFGEGEKLKSGFRR